MKKLVTFRLDVALLEQLRGRAQAENRTLTNFVETVLKRSCDLNAFGDTPSPPAIDSAHRSPSTN